MCCTSCHNQRYRGQSVVELALVSPILIFLIIVTADTGRAFSAHIAIGNAAREGAAFGARAEEYANDPDAVRAEVLAETGEIFGTLPTVESNVRTDEFGYDYIEVLVSFQFEPILPMPGFGDTITLERSTEMRIVGI